jgi:hypothetical protein
VPAQKEQKLKSGQGEDSTHAEPTKDAQKAAAEETGAHSMEALSHALAHAEKEDAKESKEAHAEAREQAEREDKPSGGFFARVFGKKAPEKPQPKSQAWAQAKPQGQQQPQLKKSLRDGFEKSDPRLNALNSASFQSLAPVRDVKAAMAAPVRTDKPLDAYAALRQAKDKGVLFKEDWEREGHSEDQDDPELADAVEDVIAKLFGRAGVLRVGPGRNEQGEPIVVVVATHGFSDASLAAVPERSGRFPVMLALSFDLLPLRRER